jgi:hypothetical protein
MSRHAFCAVVSAAFVPTARCLAQSLDQTNRGTPLYVFVVDARARDLPRGSPGLTFLSSRRLGAPAAMYRYYTNFELCNALRPVALAHLLARGHDKVVYLDTDIWVTGKFTDVWRGLDRRSFGYAPHITRPYPRDGKRPNELAFLQWGVYNSGFLAFRNDAVAREALALWADRMRRWAFFDPPALHVGQDFLDLLAVFYRDHFWFIDHPGLNIAYWNLGERRLTRHRHGIRSNGKEAIFFHLSGYDPRQPRRLTRFPGRHGFGQHPILREVYGAYRAALRRFTGGVPAETHPKFRDTVVEKSKRRYYFVHRTLAGYSLARARRLCDPTTFNELLLDIR